MDLLSTVRKTGSRGGVNFSWEDVATSTHRENYLGHSLKAPVGRWQQGRDLNWYAKSDPSPAGAPRTGDESDETAEEKKARERREELRKIKEAEEDAIARALGLPMPVRDASGANATEFGPAARMGGVLVNGKVDADADASGSRRKDDREKRRHGDSDRHHRRRHHHHERSRSPGQSRDKHSRRRDESTERPFRREHYRRRYRSQSRRRDNDRGRNFEARRIDHNPAADNGRDKNGRGRRSRSREIYRPRSRER